jgi:hypothetical protein
VLAWLSAYDEFGVGDQSMPERNLFDDIGVVAWSAEPLVDHVDQSDVVGAIEAGVHQIGSIDVEDHESCPAAGWTGYGIGGGGGFGMSKFHAVIMARGCYTVV